MPIKSHTKRIWVKNFFFPPHNDPRRIQTIISNIIQYSIIYICIYAYTHMAVVRDVRSIRAHTCPFHHAYQTRLNRENNRRMRTLLIEHSYERSGFPVKNEKATVNLKIFYTNSTYYLNVAIISIRFKIEHDQRASYTTKDTSFLSAVIFIRFCSQKDLTR